MCQLLGMSAKQPTDFVFSFRGFRERGGATARHVDGWGVAAYEGKGCRCYIDLGPSCKSPIAELLTSYPIRTLNMISHVRLATQGRTKLENCHPFQVRDAICLAPHVDETQIFYALLPCMLQRELWGKYWTFAHNGQMDMSHLERSRPQTMRFNPVGDTDSELLFCLLLEHLLASFPEGSPPDHHSMHNIVLRFWLDLCEPSGTICNFLLSDGTCLLAGCWPGKRPSSDVWNSLFYCVRKYPFTYATLSDCDHKINFSDVAGPDDRVAVIATEKLTSDEEWFEIPKGKLIVFLQGMPLLTDEHILLGRTESARRDPTKIIATAQSESALL